MTHTIQDKQRTRTRARNMIIFASVALVWFFIDYFSKKHFSNAFESGELLPDSLLGLIRFRMVHNSGAAWGIFDDSTMVLGFVSVLVCILLLVYLLVVAPRANIVEAIGLGLVFAGGIGNAFDRFLLGYVVDFLEFTFIDFPVFNVADIGVTCGFIIFIFGFILNISRTDKQEDKPSDNVSAKKEE